MSRTEYRTCEVNSHYITQQELRILRLLAEGNERKQIARTMLLSPNTIGTYITRLRDKTGCRNQAHLVAWAYDHNFVERKNRCKSTPG